jgi:hypothetical protein
MTKEDIKRIRELLEFLVKQKISEKIKKLSADDKIVYDLTGKKRDFIQERTGFAAGKISRIWSELEEKGVLVKKGKSYKKVV